MKDWMGRLRSYALTLDMTFGSWLASFAGIVLIRIFFEQFSNFQSGHFVLIDLPTLVHYSVFYIASTLALMTILLSFGKTSIKEVAGISIIGLGVVCIAPLIDLVAGGVGTHTVSYLFVSGRELLLRFFTFFGGHFHEGITLGIQVETVLGIIFCYTYVHNATKNIARAVMAAVVFYCVIFFLVSVPSLVALVLPQSNGPIAAIAQSMITSHALQNNMNPNFSATSTELVDLVFNKMMAGINTILAILAGVMLACIAYRKKFTAMIKNCRPESLFHFFLLFVFGVAVAHAGFSGNWIDVQDFVLSFFAITFAWMFCVCQNDIYDTNIDSISNADRPMISGELSREDMETSSNIFILFTFLSAYAAGSYTIFFTIFFLLIYFIYSNPPLRLKRFVILNSFLVSLACLSVILMGFFLVSPDKNLISFPPRLVLAIIIFFTAVANVRDLKDVDGDMADGIKTLPVLIGLRKSQKIIAGVICFFFILMPWYFHIPTLLIPSLIAAGLSWYFITSKNYANWKGFVVYMIYLICIISALFLK